MTAKTWQDHYYTLLNDRSWCATHPSKAALYRRRLEAGSLAAQEPESEMDTLQESVGAWGDVTFPESDVGTITAHLLSEAAEMFFAAGHSMVEGGAIVLDAAVKDPEHTKTPIGEAGGIQMLLFHLAHKHGVSLSDLTRTTFRRDAQRRWLAANTRGFREHDPAHEVEKEPDRQPGEDRPTQTLHEIDVGAPPHLTDATDQAMTRVVLMLATLDGSEAEKVHSDLLNLATSARGRASTMAYEWLNAAAEALMASCVERGLVYPCPICGDHHFHHQNGQKGASNNGKQSDSTQG